MAKIINRGAVPTKINPPVEMFCFVCETTFDADVPGDFRVEHREDEGQGRAWDAVEARCPVCDNQWLPVPVGRQDQVKSTLRRIKLSQSPKYN